MKPITIRLSETSRRNPLVLVARRRQAGPHRDGRLKEARKLAQQEMLGSMNYRRSTREAHTDE